MTSGLLALALLVVGAGCGDDDQPTGTAIGPGDRGDSSQGRTDAAKDGDSGEASTVSGGPSVNPCDLLEISEIEAQLGEGGAVAEGVWAEQGPSVNGATCSWDIGNPPDRGGFVIVIVVHRNQGPAMFEGPFYGDPFNGLGDEAYLTTSSAGTGIQVISGDWFIDLTGFLYPDPGGMPDRVVALGENVLDRL